MNSLELKLPNLLNKILSTSGYKYVTLGDQEYKLFWTSHAQHRAQYRQRSNTVILGSLLVNTLKTISKNLAGFDKIEGYVTIRDFFTGYFTVINIDKKVHEIKIITCEKTVGIYPRNGDTYIQRNKDNSCKCFVWKRKKKKSA